ncbi:hypothetical protein ACWKSP_40150 [Micromonosporaceae bacterium Da 78-11]
MDVSVAITGPASKSADTQPRVSTGAYPRVYPTMRVLPIATARRGLPNRGAVPLGQTDDAINVGCR